MTTSCQGEYNPPLRIAALSPWGLNLGCLKRRRVHYEPKAKRFQNCPREYCPIDGEAIEQEGRQPEHKIFIAVKMKRKRNMV